MHDFMKIGLKMVVFGIRFKNLINCSMMLFYVVDDVSMRCF